MSNEAMGYVYRYSPYRSKILMIHLAIADSVNDQHGNQFWLPMSRLATKARCTRPTAVAAVQRLVADGFLASISESKGGGRPGEGASQYRFLFPPVPVVFESRSVKISNTGSVKPLNGSVKTTGALGTRASLLKPREPKKGNLASQQKSRTQDQIESDRRYGGEGARFPESTPEYRAAVEAIADLPDF